MSFTKRGEALEIDKIESTASCVTLVDPEILENFRKFAANLKRLAPKAEDFLYFSAVMMHAAEAAALNDDGTPRLTASGSKVEVGWDKSANTWRWKSNDTAIKPYKNSNGDIFPEEELIKAFRKWVGKPLCVDHKSSSVEHVRGFIVDTYYDRNLKRVVALCALDKAGYPQLARQISTGVSNCVSMGTAVGKAICSDCARVARTEADFCDHMRRKSCYGEINIDLNPIELSIVVNGADPRANIKHIIAAANTMNTYLDNKQQELQKLAESTFQANLSFNVGDTTDSANLSHPGKVTQVNVTSKDLETFKRDVEKAIEEYQQIQSSLSNEENSVGSGNVSTSNQESGAEADTPTADSGLAPPHARFASTEVGAEAIEQLRATTKSIEGKIAQLKNGLEKLASTTTNTQTQEEHMSGNNIKQGYFQGAGGVNEPTPGQVKYPIDPLNVQLRDHEDKQMVGQNGFPGVGPVDGMHPSPVSADQKDELERKKMLARAELEDRAMRRQAIVELAQRALEEKKAYFQNGLEKGNVNTPTPGKVKYPIDPLNVQLRDHEDKQMVGQKPFPNVGPVDGMHPSPQSAETSDELKRKEMLRRASLRARFVKTTNEDGSQNFAKSAWEVFRGDQLILSASVDELSGGNIAGLYDSIATKEFGVKLIEKVKKDGADKVLSLFKRAQVPPPPAGADSSAPPVGDVAPPADSSVPPMGDSGPVAEDKGGNGTPQEKVVDIADKVLNLVSDMKEAAEGLAGEKKEMGDVGSPGADAAPEMGVAASFSNSTMNSLHRELNGALSGALKESIADLTERHSELQEIADLYRTGAVDRDNKSFVDTVAEEAANGAKSAFANGFKLMQGFVKYVRGTQAIVKRAEIDAELAALAADGDSSSEPSTDTNSDEDLMNLIQSADADLDAVNTLLADDAGASEGLEGIALDANDATLTVKPGEVVPANTPAGMEVKVTQASLNTKEGRAALRAKLAADATGKEDDGNVQDMSKAKFSDMLQEADHLADGQTQLDTKPSDSLGLVETLPEQNKAMMEVAKAPPNVRKEAEAINRLVVTGKLDPKDIDALVAEGLDKDAVAYWKKYYGQTDGGSEFATELVKEHAKAQLEGELNKFRVKLARAYEMAYDMVDRGLCHNDRATISDQVDQIMKFNEDGFNTLKRLVAQREPVARKTAGHMPQVGMIGSGEITATAAVEDDNLFSQLSAAFSKTSKRTF
jgi:predicted translin family RNA/ssDNA-binding protein